MINSADDCKYSGVIAEIYNSAIEKGNFMIIKVLKDAYWAFDFYQKHGYKQLNTM